MFSNDNDVPQHNCSPIDNIDYTKKNILNYLNKDLVEQIENSPPNTNANNEHWINDNFMLNVSEEGGQKKKKQKKKKNFTEREGDWTCFECKNLNFAFRKKCNRCKVPKNISDEKHENFMQNVLNIITENEKKRVASNDNDEDFNYQVETTQNVPIPTAKPINDTIYNYKDQLETKIREQAKRLAELEKYKYLCEKRIKQLCPKHPLPLTEAVLTSAISSIDVVNAEEQKNYYDMLKKTIEVDLIKNGLLSRNISVDGVIDFANMRIELEDYKKKLIVAQSMINSLKSDIDELTREKAMLNGFGQPVAKSEVNALERENKELAMKCERAQKEKNAYEIQIAKLQAENNAMMNQIMNKNAEIKSLAKSNENQSESINRKLIEYKSNYEKINNDFEKLINEKNNAMKRNNELISENKSLHSQITSFEVEIEKLKALQNEKNVNEINADYKKMYNDLLIENANIKMLINSMQNQTSQNDEFANSKMNDYFAKMQKEFSEMQIENEKIKIDLRNMIEEKNNIENECDNAKKYLKQANIEKAKNAKYIEKTISENEKLKSELNQLREINRKLNDDYTKLTLIKDENTKSHNELSSQLSETNRKFAFLHEQYTQSESKLVSLESLNKTLIEENERLKANMTDKEKKIKLLEDKSEKYAKDNDNVRQSEKKLKQIIEATEAKVEETLEYNSQITNQIKQMESAIEAKDSEIEQMQNDKKNFESEVFAKLKIFDEYVSSTKSEIHKLIHSLNLIANEFDKNANEDLNSHYSKNFAQGITQIISQITSLNNVINYDLHLDDKLFFETISKFISILSSEVDFLYEKGKSEICEVNRVITMEDEKRSKVENELCEVKEERDSLFKELSSIKAENFKLSKVNELNKIELSDLKDKIRDLNEKNQKCECKLRYHEQSRKHLISLFKSFARSYPYKDFAKTMCDILTLNESIAKVELEKFIIEDKLSQMNANVIDDTELCSIVKKEHENLKKLFNDYDAKLSKQKEKMNILNANYAKLDQFYKDQNDLYFTNYQKAAIENGQLKNIIEHLTNREGNKKNIVIETSLKNCECSKIEINQDENINHNNDNNDAVCLTDYDELEEEYIRKSNKET